MLAYPIPEAEDLLDNKLKTAQLSLTNCQEDLDFLREQITVCARFSTACSSAVLTSYRLWRSPPHACITGTLPSDVRRDLILRKPRARSRRIEKKKPIQSLNRRWANGGEPLSPTTPRPGPSQSI